VSIHEVLDGLWTFNRILLPTQRRERLYIDPVTDTALYLSRESEFRQLRWQQYIFDAIEFIFDEIDQYEGSYADSASWVKQLLNQKYMFMKVNGPHLAPLSDQLRVIDQLINIPYQALGLQPHQPHITEDMEKAMNTHPRRYHFQSELIKTVGKITSFLSIFLSRNVIESDESAQSNVLLDMMIELNYFKNTHVTAMLEHDSMSISAFLFEGAILGEFLQETYPNRYMDRYHLQDGFVNAVIYGIRWIPCFVDSTIKYDHRIFLEELCIFFKNELLPLLQQTTVAQTITNWSHIVFPLTSVLTLVADTHLCKLSACQKSARFREEDHAILWRRFEKEADELNILYNNWRRLQEHPVSSAIELKLLVCEVKLLLAYLGFQTSFMEWPILYQQEDPHRLFWKKMQDYWVTACRASALEIVLTRLSQSNEDTMQVEVGLIYAKWLRKHFITIAMTCDAYEYCARMDTLFSTSLRSCIESCFPNVLSDCFHDKFDLFSDHACMQVVDRINERNGDKFQFPIDLNSDESQFSIKTFDVLKCRFKAFEILWDNLISETICAWKDLVETTFEHFNRSTDNFDLPPKKSMWDRWIAHINGKD
jgi:hypothetical protein